MTPRRGPAIAAALLLAGCSATQLVYNRLDWLASWEVGRYVDLDGSSKALFDRSIATLWRWHRATQLSLYSRDLRELAAAAARPLSRDQVHDYVLRARAHGARLFEETLPRATEVFAALDGREVTGLVRNLGQERDRRNAEDADLGLKGLQQRKAEEMNRRLRHWLGRLSDEQQQKTRVWSEARRYDPSLIRAFSMRWTKTFGELLESRRGPDFAIRLRQLFVEPDIPERSAVEQLRDHNREAFVDFPHRARRDAERRAAPSFPRRVDRLGRQPR